MGRGIEGGDSKQPWQNVLKDRLGREVLAKAEAFIAGVRGMIDNGESRVLFYGNSKVSTVDFDADFRTATIHCIFRGMTAEEKTLLEGAGYDVFYEADPYCCFTVCGDAFDEMPGIHGF